MILLPSLTSFSSLFSHCIWVGRIPRVYLFLLLFSLPSFSLSPSLSLSFTAPLSPPFPHCLLPSPSLSPSLLPLPFLPSLSLCPSLTPSLPPITIPFSCTLQGWGYEPRPVQLWELGMPTLLICLYHHFLCLPNLFWMSFPPTNEKYRKLWLGLGERNSTPYGSAQYTGPKSWEIKG